MLILPCICLNVLSNFQYIPHSSTRVGMHQRREGLQTVKHRNFLVSVEISLVFLCRLPLCGSLCAFQGHSGSDEFANNSLMLNVFGFLNGCLF